MLACLHGAKSQRRKLQRCRAEGVAMAVAGMSVVRFCVSCLFLTFREKCGVIDEREIDMKLKLVAMVVGVVAV